VNGDERAILNCLSDYCHRIDLLDIEGVIDLFTPDGEYDFGMGRVYRGPQRLRTLFSRVEVYAATSHQVTNTHLELHGDHATVRSSLYAFHVRAADGSEAHVWGEYHDEFVRRAERWLIARRALRVAHEKGTRPEGGLPTLYEPLPRRSNPHSSATR
jgi:ketosteroid isomerase-like protein